MDKVYLGDGVYAEADDDALSVTLTTENGYETTNTIYLEAEVLDALSQFVKKWIYQRQAPKRESNG